MNQLPAKHGHEHGVLNYFKQINFFVMTEDEKRKYIPYVIGIIIVGGFLIILLVDWVFSLFK